MKTGKHQSKYIVLNNEIINAPEYDFSKLNLGTNIYEVIRVIDGKPLFFNEHFERFRSSVLINGNTLKITYKDLIAKIEDLIKKNQVNNCNIRYQASTNEKEIKSFSAWLQPHYYPTNKQYELGVIVGLLDTQRQIPNLKIYREEYVKLVSSALTAPSVFEVLLINERNNITEGSRSNVFFVKDDGLITPKSNQVLPGITRQKIIAYCKKNMISITEESISLKSIKRYESAFLTGTSIKVLPIASIDKFNFDTSNQLLCRLISGFNNIIEDDIISFSWNS